MTMPETLLPLPDDDVFNAGKLIFADGQPESPATANPLPAIAVRTVPKDPKFTVMLDERLPRQDTVLMQVSVPLDIHQRLKYDSMGSMNHVLMGLVRYALQKLDDEKLTLRVERKTEKQNR